MQGKIKKITTNMTYLPARQNRHYNLTPAAGIAGNVSRELQHVGNNNRLTLLCRRAAYTTAEPDLLTRRPTLEGTKPEGVCYRRGTSFCRCTGGREFIATDVEASPVNGRRRGGESSVGMPK